MIRTPQKLYHSTLALGSLVAPKTAVFVHINRINDVFLELLNVTQQGISFHQKVVYSAVDGHSLQQKSIPQRAS